MSNKTEPKKQIVEQLTFTENEFTSLKKFLNIVAVKAKFTFDTKEAWEYSKLYTEVLKLEKKIYDHILEIVKVNHHNKDEGAK